MWDRCLMRTIMCGSMTSTVSSEGFPSLAAAGRGPTGYMDRWIDIVLHWKSENKYYVYLLAVSFLIHKGRSVCPNLETNLTLPVVGLRSSVVVLLCHYFF